MSFDAETLYRLLPAVYRLRDAEGDGVLWEWVEVIAEQVAMLEEDLDQLYDDQFIETCAEWAVPYLGDLIGYRSLHQVSPRLAGSRAEVANTIAYRRRKGTASMLEQLARDVTGRDAAVVEFFQRLACTQYLNHPRPGRGGMADIRNAGQVPHGAFDSRAHTADVRHIATAGGRYNIPNVGIFLWRLRSYALPEATPAAVDARRFRFHPLGVDAPLYNRPEAETDIAHLASADNVPMPLTRRCLAGQLTRHYGTGASVSVSRGGQVVDVTQVRVCDLSDDGGGQWANLPSAGIAIDPELGRLAFAQDVDTAATPLRVGFRYGFSAELGGGGYARSDSLEPVPDAARVVPDPFPGLQAALNDIRSGGMVSLGGNGLYREYLSAWVDADRRVFVQAADQCRPTVVLEDDFEVGGGEGAELVINGLLIGGAPLRVPARIGASRNRLQRLTLKHCTLVPGVTLAPDRSPQRPGSPSIVVEIPDLVVELESCIVGALAIDPDSRVLVHNSVVDANATGALAYAAADGTEGGELRMGNATVIGRVATRALPLASNCLFLGPVHSRTVQSGCVRFSYLPAGSHVPRRYRCQPEDADPVAPWFTSLRYGDPGYAQLHPGCAEQIRRGASDESEMGALHDLRQPQREANLRERLEEYLRFGLEAGILYMS